MLFYSQYLQIILYYFKQKYGIVLNSVVVLPVLMNWTIFLVYEVAMDQESSYCVYIMILQVFLYIIL